MYFEVYMTASPHKALDKGPKELKKVASGLSDKKWLKTTKPPKQPFQRINEQYEHEVKESDVISGLVPYSCLE